MSFSLNEVEATAKRATRGAGYDWGIAEEAAKATRWLCAHDLDGAATLAAVLDHDTVALTDTGLPWRGNGPLCPLRTGAFLSDSAATLTQGPLRIELVCHPAMLLPFAANAARAHERCVTVECDGAIAVTDGLHLSMPSMFATSAQVVAVRLGGAIDAPRPHKSRATPDADAWATLNRHAHRTYAPATEQSRLLGAGAGLSDND